MSDQRVRCFDCGRYMKQMINKNPDEPNFKPDLFWMCAGQNLGAINEEKNRYTGWGCGSIYIIPENYNDWKKKVQR